MGQYRVHLPTETKTKYIYSKTRKDAAAKLAFPWYSCLTVVGQR